MGKDTTAFKERFNAYKNGKPVSEIYDAGLPKYINGTPSSNVTYSDDEALQYIAALENPGRVGWDERAQVWRQPKLKGYDRN